MHQGKVLTAWKQLLKQLRMGAAPVTATPLRRGKVPGWPKLQGAANCWEACSSPCGPDHLTLPSICKKDMYMCVRVGPIQQTC